VRLSDVPGEDEPEQPASPEEPGWAHAGREAVAGAAASLVGSAVADPAGLVLGATGPVLVRAYDWLGDRWRDQRERSASRVLTDAAEELHQTTDESAALLAEDPRRLQLARTALTAGSYTTFDDKPVEQDDDLAGALERRDRDRDRGVGFGWRAPEPRYRMTDFGLCCLDLVEASVEDVQGVSADDEEDGKGEQEGPALREQDEDQGECA
jgi:hypothetical protein